jgi:hypothetical protein
MTPTRSIFQNGTWLIPAIVLSALISLGIGSSCVPSPAETAAVTPLTVVYPLQKSDPAITPVVAGSPAITPGVVNVIRTPVKIHETMDRVFDFGGATIIYEGPVNVPAIVEVASCLNCVLKNLRIIDRSGAQAAVLLTNLPDRLGSSGCVIENIMVRYANGEIGPRVAFSIDSLALGGVDRNNDLHTLLHCQSTNHQEAGVFLRGTQVHQIVIERCAFVDYGGRRPYGVATERSGFFTLRDVGFGSTQCDVKCNGPTARIVLQGINSEHSFSLFESDRVGAPTFTRIGDVRWEGEPRPGRAVIDCFGDGPFILENGYVRSLTGIVPLIRFGHYRGPNATLPGSVSLNGWWSIVHSEIVPAGPDATVPMTWALSQTGARQMTVTSTEWTRRNMRIGRTP